MKALLGVWALEPAEDATDPTPIASNTLVADDVHVVAHLRWQAEDGGFQQFLYRLRRDGQPAPFGDHPTLTSRLREDGDALIIEMLLGDAVVQRERRWITEEGHLMVHQTAHTPDGPVEHSTTWARTSTKQVICYRRDLKMRKGKIAAQCAHASMGVFLRRDRGPAGSLQVDLDGPMTHWCKGRVAKVVLSVETEEDLLKVHAEANRRLLPACLVTDAGRTEFKGVPTRTAVAIGPAAVHEIDAITGKEGIVATKLA